MNLESYCLILESFVELVVNTATTTKHTISADNECRELTASVDLNFGLFILFKLKGRIF